MFRPAPSAARVNADELQQQTRSSGPLACFGKGRDKSKVLLGYLPTASLGLPPVLVVTALLALVLLLHSPEVANAILQHFVQTWTSSPVTKEHPFEDTLRARIEVQHRRIQQLQNLLTSEQARAQALGDDTAELRHDNDLLLQQGSPVTLSLTEVKNQKAAAERRAVELQKKLTKERESVTKLEKMLYKERVGMEQLQQWTLEAHQAQQKAERQLVEEQRKEMEHKTAEKDRRELQKMLQKEQEAVKKMKGAVKKATERLEDQHWKEQALLEQQKSRLQVEVEKLAASERSRRAAERQLSELESQVDADDGTSGRVAELEDELEKRQARSTRAAAEAQKALKASEQRRAELEELLTNAQAELRNLIQMKLSPAAEASRVQVGRLKAELDEMKSKRKDLSAELSRTQAQLLEEQTSQQGEASHAAALQSEARLAEQRTKQAEAELTRQRFELGELNRKLADERQQHATVAERLNDMRVEAASRRQQARFNEKFDSQAADDNLADDDDTPVAEQLEDAAAASNGDVDSQAEESEQVRQAETSWDGQPE